MTARGMRSLTTTSPLALLTASTKLVAQVFSKSRIPAEELFSSEAVSSRASSSFSIGVTSETSGSHWPKMSGSRSLNSSTFTSPSLFLTAKRRSTMRTVPSSTSSANAGMISPENWLPGNFKTSSSIGPRATIFLHFLSQAGDDTRTRLPAHSVVAAFLRPSQERQEHQNSAEAGPDQCHRATQQLETEFPQAQADQVADKCAKDDAADPEHDELPAAHRSTLSEAAFSPFGCALTPRT